MHDDLDHLGPGERTRFAVLPDFGGTEVLEARFVRHRFAPHYHDHLVFGVISGGVEAFRYRGVTHLGTAGQFATVNPNEVHDGYPGADGGWCYHMLYLPTAFAQTLAAEMLETDRAIGTPGFKTAVFRDDALYGPTLAAFRRLRMADMLERQEILTDLTAAMFRRHVVALDRRHKSANAGIAPIDRVRQLLADDPAHGWRLEDLAALAALSRFQVLRQFRASYGLTPHAYQTVQRLHRAETLLRRGEAIAEVAIATGFADQAHLTRNFKRMRGVAPGMFRSQARALPA